MRQLIFGLTLLTFSITGIGSAHAEESEKPAAQVASFAGGCFWGMQKIFDELPGVVSTRVGYTGGSTENPTYRQVTGGKTGHAESIEVTYDPTQIRYEDLLEFFFTHHNPTSVNRQGNDRGTQYRSVIFTHSPEQLTLALKAKKLLTDSGVFKMPIATEIVPASSFYPAEGYHQKYLEKNPHGYCEINLQSRKVREVLEKGLGK